MELQRRPGHDDRPPRIVHALAQQVEAEAALLAFEHVRQRLQRPVVLRHHRLAAPPVVEQGVYGFLQHPLFVVDDDVGRADLQELLETVVAVDDAAVEVVEVGSGEAASVQLHHRAQVGRNDGDGVENYRSRVAAETAVVVSAVERAEYL